MSTTVLKATSILLAEYLEMLSSGYLEYIDAMATLTDGTRVLMRRKADNRYQLYLVTDLTSTTTLPTIVAQYSQIGKTAAITNAISFTPPATAGRYSFMGVANVTAWTTPASFTVVVVYRDDSGTTQTETLAIQRGTTGAIAAAITAVDRWYFELPLFAINNGQVAITLSTTGTFTGSPVYNFAAVLMQLV